jgi:hypothetical protein
MVQQILWRKEKLQKQLFALLSRVYLYLGDDANVILYGNLALAGNTVCP